MKPHPSLIPARSILFAALTIAALLGINSASAQTYTNLYWDPDGATSSITGGSGTWSTNTTNWNLNSAGGAGNISPTNGANGQVNASGNYIFTFGGTNGTVGVSQSLTVGGLSFLTSGYTVAQTSSTLSNSKTFTANSANAPGVYITNNANVNFGLSNNSTAFTFNGMGISGDAGASISITNNSGNTNFFNFGTSSTAGGKTNSVNTVVNASGTLFFGTPAATNGFVQSGDITNNSTGTFIITNGASGAVDISGAISGSAGLTLANGGSGRIWLGASNSYAGGTVISNTGSGSFGVSNSSAFGSGTVTSAGSGVTNNLQPDANNLNIANNWQLDTGNTLRLGVNNGTNFTASGNMAGAGSVLIGGTNATNSTVVLSGNNSYTGATTVSSGGTLQVGNANALGGTAGGTTVSSGATLDLNGQSVGAEPVTISGTGVGAAGALRNTSASASSLAGPVTLVGNTTIGLSAGNIALSGNIGESGGARNLTVAGTNGIVTLSGSNNYSGITSVTNTVTLSASAVDALSSKSSLEGASALARTPTLDLTAPGSYRMNSYLGGNFILLATNGAANLTFTNVGTGNVIVGGSRTITATDVAVTFDGAVDISQSGAAKTLTLAGNSDFTFNGSILTTNTSFTSGLVVSSTGLTTLNASNNYDGTTTVSAGATLRLANSYAMGAANSLTNSVASGAALQLQGGIAIEGEILALNGRGVSDNGVLRNISGNNTYNGLIELNSTNRINSDAGTLTIGAFTNGLSSSKQLIIGGAGNTVMAGALNGTGSGRLIKDGTGTLTISAANTVNGGITVGAGSLVVSSTGSITASAANSVIISNGASLRYNGAGALIVGSIDLGAGGGPGRAVLGGSGTINSAVTLDALTDVLSPGNSPGIMSFGTNQVWTSFSYDWELNNFTGTTAGTDFDQISIAGSLDLTGGTAFQLNILSLTAGNIPGDVPNFLESDTTWTILSASGGITGFSTNNWTLDTTAFSSSPTALGSFSVSQLNNDLLLTYTVPEPSTYALLALAAGGLFVVTLRSRRRTLAKSAK
jgi:autotransporter-associated beta strand protein